MKRQITSVMFWFFLGLSSLLCATSALAETIQGRVSLPASNIAPAGGVLIDIFGYDSVNGGFDSTAVTIPAGQSFVDYTLTVTGSPSSDWNVEYFCQSNCEGYLNSIFYAAAGTVYVSFEADGFPNGQNYSDIDISLERANLISGEVFLPSPDVAPVGGVDVEILVSNASSNASYFVSDFLNIPEGSSLASYNVKIPFNYPGELIIEYFCFENCSGYVSRAYYNNAGSTVSFNEAERFFSGSNYADVNVDVLRAIDITGTLALPVGQVAPAGGIDFFVSAVEDGGSFGLSSVTVNIPEGQSQLNYSIGIEPDALRNWFIGYECFSNCDGYSDRGYYSTAGTVGSQNDASSINGGASSANIDLNVLGTDVLSGTISLPSGFVAPAGGITINVNGNTDGFTQNVNQTVEIPAGLNSVAYMLEIPANSSEIWRVFVSCDFGCSGIVPRVYYATTGATTEFSEATEIPGGSDVSGLDVTLLDGAVVSGTISLPAGEVAPTGGISVQVDVRSTDFQIFGGDFVTIAAGQNSATFESVTVSDSSTELRVGYRCVVTSSNSSGCSGTSSYGFYNSSGTVANAPEATLLAADQDHTNIDMVLIPAIQFSGDVTLPSGVVAPPGGIEILITGIKQPTIPDDFSGDGVNATVLIPEGQASVSYILDIPEDGGLDWTISYSCFTNCGALFERGFYADSGTVFVEDQATLLPGQVGLTNIDMALFVANVIEGSVSLSSGSVAPAGGITFDVRSDGTRTSNGQSVFGDSLFDLLIPEGESSVAYSLKIEPDTDIEWNVSYSCFDDSCGGYTNEGYYGDSATVPILSEATLIAGGVDTIEVDLVFLPAVEISGTVTIPEDLDISGDNIYFQVFIYDRSRPSEFFFESLGSAFFGMTGQITSFDYNTAVFDDPNADLFVGATCFDFSLDGSSPCDAFVNSTFYGDPNSEFSDGSAVILQGGQDHSGIDILLIEADVISGTVSLPTGVAPAGGIDVNVAAFEPATPFTFGDSFSINIPENDSSASYKLRVPAGLPANSWVVEAQCTNNCDNYESSQYYASASSTPIQEQATRLPNTESYSGIDISLLPASMISAFSCDVLLDDFSGETLDLDNWRDPEFSGEIVNEKVLIQQKLISTEERFTFGDNRRFNLNLLTFPATISADVELIEADLTNSGAGSAFASVRGSFYYTLDSEGDYDDNLGEVFADVEIGDRGNGLEAWYQIIESTSSDFETWIIHVDETLIPAGTLQLNTTYTLSLGYNDATKEFTFSVDGTSASATGPAEGSAVVPDIGLFRGFTAGAAPAENQDSDPISVVATFDNIMANGALVDDFSALTLNDAVWEQAIRSRNIEQGKLRTSVTAESVNRRSLFTSAQPSDYANASCLQATLGIESSSVIPANARGRNRIDGYWYNALHDGSSGSEYNGSEGTVYAQVVLEQIEDGSVRGALYAEQVDDANYDSATPLVFHSFTTPAALDGEYVAAIQLDSDNNRLLFRFEDEVFSLPILTDINPVNPEIDYVGFTARIQDGIGQVNATIDDVYITPLPDPVDPPAADEEMCFPIVGPAGIAVICI